MKTIEFVKMDKPHAKEVMDIFNYYAENSFSAYPEHSLPYEFFGRFLEMTTNYPAFSMMDKGKVVGFCFIRAYNPFPVFKKTAEISYFIDKEYSGKGLGKIALDKLLEEAKKMEIENILASISSENVASLNFHKKFGYSECGRFKEIGTKFGKKFDVVWMMKKIV